MTKNRTRSQGKVSGGQKKKACVCSFRIEQVVKERLQAVADQKGRSLSSLIERILNNFLGSYEKGNSPFDSAKQERREHTRRDIFIPARWRVGNKYDFVEYDVLVENISRGGTCTVYSNGYSFRVLEQLQAQPFRLFIKLPGLWEPVELDCEARRFHITKASASVGIEFVNVLRENVLFPKSRDNNFMRDRWSK
jgi:predicted DNA-binding protein